MRLALWKRTLKHLLALLDLLLVMRVHVIVQKLLLNELAVTELTGILEFTAVLSLHVIMHCTLGTRSEFTVRALETTIGSLLILEYHLGAYKSGGARDQFFQSKVQPKVVSVICL